MRAILLAGGPAEREAAYPQSMPRPFWPVIMRPLVLRTIDQMCSGGVSAFSVCANGRTALYADRLAREPLGAEEIRFSQDPLPRGPAGCVKDNETFIAGEPFLVAHAASWISDDPATLFKRHRDQGNKLTVFCLPGTQTPSGVYVCEPDILDHIPGVGYCDIKEQLIPRLLNRGLRVGALPLRDVAGEVLNIRSYLALLQRVLTGPVERELRRLGESYEQLAPAVWVACDAHVDPSARLCGPVVIGPRARIEEDVVVIGPSIIGKNVNIGRGAILSECAVWSHVQVPAGASAFKTVVAAPALPDRMVSDARCAPQPREHAAHA